MRVSTVCPAGLPPPASVLRAAREHADTNHSLLVKTSDNVIQVGLHLQAARNALGRMRFRPWPEAEFRWSQPVASNYMRVAKNFSELDCLDRFQASALFMLARKKCPLAGKRRWRGGNR